MAVATGYAASHVAARGIPEPFPVDVTQYLFHLAIAAMLLGIAESTGRVPDLARRIARGVFSLAAVWVLLQALGTWESPVAQVMWILALGLGVFAMWSGLEWRAEHLEGFALPLVLLIVAAGGAKALEAARSGLLGQGAGAVAAALGPVVLMGFLNPRLTLSRGCVAVVSLLLASLWMGGHFFAELHWASAVLLAVAPLAATKKRWWAGALVAAILVGVAFSLTQAANAPPPDAPDDPYAEYFD